MFNQLGLGVRFDLEDNFTPKAKNVASSMGQIAMEAEDMEKKVQTSMNNLQNVMLAGFSLDQVGGKIEKFGQTVTGAVRGAIKEVETVGQQFETLKLTMNTFFKEETESAMKWGVNLAAKTPFEIEPVVQAMTSFKAIGIDVRKEFEYINAEGKKASKTFMEFVGDIAGFRPDIGVKGVMEGLRNYLGGSKKSLRSRLDVDERLMIGREFDTTNMENFQRDVVEFASKVAPDMMKNLEGSFDQVVSNMGDSWVWFKYQISEAGVFDAMKQTLMTVAGIIDEIDIEAVAHSIGNAFKMIWKPVDFIITNVAKGVKALAGMIESNPILGQIAIGLATVVGLSSIVVGKVMKLVGGFLILNTSIISAYSNLKILGTFGKLDGVFNIASNLKNMIASFGVATVAISTFAYAFKNNVGGMADKLDEFKSRMGLADEILEVGILTYFDDTGVAGLHNSYNETALFIHDGLEDIVWKFLWVKTVFGTVGKTLFSSLDEDGNIPYTQAQLENLKALGLMPFAQSLAIIRGRVSAFFEGFKGGMDTVFTMLGHLKDVFLLPIKGILDAIKEMDIVKRISEKYDLNGEKGLKLSDAEQQIERWKKIGRAVGGVAGAIVGLKTVAQVGKFLQKPFFTIKDGAKDAQSAVKDLNKDMKKFTLNPFELGRRGKQAFFGGLISLKNDFVERRKKPVQDLRDYLGEYQNLPEFSSTKHRGYSRVGYDSNNPMQGLEYFNSTSDAYKQGRLYARTPKTPFGKGWEKLFGRRYYSLEDGEMIKGTRYGGRLRKGIDDVQTGLALESQVGKGGLDYFSAQRRMGIYDMFPNLAKASSEEKANAIAKYKDINKNKLQLGTYITSIDKLKGSPESRGEVMQDFLRDYMYDDELGAGRRKRAFKMAGIKDARVFNGVNNPRAGERDNIFMKFAKHSPEFAEASARQKAGVFRDDRQDMGLGGRLGRALFGTKYYTPYETKSGKYKQRVVMRDGGLLRSSRNDMKYLEGGFHPLKMIGELPQEIKYRAKQFSGFVGDTFSEVKGALSTFTGAFTNTKAFDIAKGVLSPVTKFFGKVATPFKAIGTGVAGAFGGLGEKLGGKLGGFSLPGLPSLGFGGKLRKGLGGIGGKLAGTRVGQGVGALKGWGADKLSGLAGFFGQHIDPDKDYNSLGGIFKGAGKGLMKGFGAVENFALAPINALRKRAGVEGQFGFFGRGEGADRKDGIFSKALGGAFRGLFGRKTDVLDDEGKLIGRERQGGLFKKVGGLTSGIVKGVGKGIKGGFGILGRGVRGVGRVAGAVAPLALGAGALGAGIHSRVKEMGDGDFGKGLDIVQEKINKLDVEGFVKRFTEGITKFGPQLGEIFKTAFTSIASNAPQIFEVAWNGIKAGASFMWDFIQEHGITILKGVGRAILTILGDAWQGIKVVAGVAWDWIKEYGPEVMANMWEKIKTTAGLAWDWMKTDGFNKLSEAIKSFASWFVHTGIPKLVGSAVELGRKMGKALHDKLTEWGQTALDAIGKKFEQWKDRYQNFRESNTDHPFAPGNQGGNKGGKGGAGGVTSTFGLSLRASHGGEWLQPEEEMKIIRKDETILPPGRAKRLDNLLDSSEFAVRNAVGVAGVAGASAMGGNNGPVDNSMTIENVTIAVEAGRLSTDDARQQALYILEELRKIEKEKEIRAFA